MYRHRIRILNRRVLTGNLVRLQNWSGAKDGCNSAQIGERTGLVLARHYDLGLFGLTAGSALTGRL